MILRPYQDRAVGKIAAALEEHGRTLFVAATGAGKTVILSETIRRAGLRTLVLQHRDELVEQNRRTLRRVAPHIPTSLYTAGQKRWSSGVTYGMVQTVTRNLSKMPSLGLVIVDEAHLYRAPTFQAVVERALEVNPGCKVLGVTATPKRGDGASMKALFDNVCDEITIGELVRGGHLVPPRAFVLDVGVNDRLDGVRMLRTGDYDSKQVENILCVAPVTERVVDHWQAKAGDRSTIVFCATRHHAEEVTAALVSRGVTAALVHGGTAKDERARIVAGFDLGHIQVLVNVSIAREGFDSQRVACIVLLRMESFESTLIQMVGRGLRTVDPARYPGVVKSDCIVLDFGRSLLKHGGISQVFRLTDDPKEDKEKEPGAAPQKVCPSCEMRVPISVHECPACGAAFPVAERDEKDRLDDFGMVELDLLLESSPFRWWSRNEKTRCVAAFDAWSIVCEVLGVWHAFGGSSEAKFAHLAVGDEARCVAAGDDWMRRHADSAQAGKATRWHRLPPTDAQVGFMRRLHLEDDPRGLTRYTAGCCIQLKLEKDKILRHLQQLALQLTSGAA